MKNDQIKFNIFFVLIILLLLFFHARDVFAETTVGGLITTDTTWTKANSPYIVSDSVLVNSGVTLTIEAGTTVRFNGAKALQINGGLIARGIETDKITFTANIQSPSIEYWGGVIFSPSSISAIYDNDDNYLNGSIMKYCTVEYVGGADALGAISLTAAYPLFEYCTIQNNIVKGIYFFDYTCSSANTCSNIFKFHYGKVIYNKDVGIFVKQAKVSIKYNLINNNSPPNTISYPWDYSSSINVLWGYGGTIYKNIIENNIAYPGGIGGGIRYTSGGGAIQITSNELFNNKADQGGGMYIGASSSSIINGNILKNNTAYLKGGGLYITSGGSPVPVVSNNTIENNNAPDGAAIYDTGSNIYQYNSIKYNGVSIPNCFSLFYVYNNTTINSNNLYDNNCTYDLFNNGSNISLNKDAKNNYWGTTDETVIKARIYDWFDDPSKGIVDYSPFATSNIDTFGSITGTVKNNATAELIVGASVSGSFGSVTTDGLGKYLISNLSSDVYTLTINASKYISSTTNNVTVSPGAQTVLDISLVPKTTGTLTGQVLNSEGLTPISTVTVKVTKGTDSFTKVTDVNGNFGFSDLLAGNYAVELISTSYWSNQHGANVNIDETTQLTITGIPQAIAGEIRNGWFTQDQLNQAVADANAAKDLLIASMFTKEQLDKAVVDANAAKDLVIAAMFTKEQLDKAVVDANAAKDLVIAAMFTKTQLDKAVAEERIKWDINNDGKMGLVEVIYILQKVAGAR